MKVNKNKIVKLRDDKDVSSVCDADVERPESSPARKAVLFEAIFASMKDAVIFTDKERHIVAINAAAASLFGHATGELTGKTQEILYAVQGQREEQGQRPHHENAEEEEKTNERLCKRNDGSIFICETWRTKVKNHAGEPAGFITIHRDITERKKAEEELKASEAKYREIFNASNDAICICDTVTGEILDVNPKMCEVSKTSREKLIGGTIQAMSFRENLSSQEDALKWIREAAADGPRSFEWLCTEREDAPFWGEVSLKGCVLQGKARVLAIVRDITARKKAEDALRESEKKYRSFVDNASVGIYQTTIDGRILNVNQALLDFFECKTKEEMTSKRAETFYKDPEVRKKLISVLETEGRAIDREAEFVTVKGRTRWGILSGVIKDDLITGMIMDITEHRRAEEKLKFVLQQQEAIAELGMLSITDIDPQHLFQWTVSLVAHTLNVEFCKIMELLPDGKNLQLTAGSGFAENATERIAIGIGTDSQPSFTLLSDNPVIVDNVRTETRFASTPMIRNEKIISGMSVKIQGSPIPYGVLSVHTITQRKFTDKEAVFLQSIANILGQAIVRQKAEKALQESERKYRSIIENTDTGFAVVSEDGVVFDANAEYIRLSGHGSLDEIAGKKFVEWTAEYDRERHLEAHKKLVDQGFIKNLDIDFSDRDGRTVPVEIDGMFVAMERGRQYTLLVRDVSERRRLQEQLKAVAITDYLTGLFNRRGFFTLAEQQCKLADRAKQRMALLYIDLDNMKQINDTLGHKEGDRALIDSANLLRKTFREADIVARIGGDEFAVLMTAPSEPVIEETISGHIQRGLNLHNSQGGRPYLLSFSIGFVHYDPDRPCAIGELLSIADSRMYEVKKKHRLDAESDPARSGKMNERRRYERAPAGREWVAELEGVGKAGIRNVSPGGIDVRTVRNIPAGTRCDMLIHTPPHEDVRHNGIVVWSHYVVKGRKIVDNEYCCEAGIQFI